MLLAACVLLLVWACGPLAGTALVVSKPLESADAVISLASHEWERLPLTARVAAANPDAIVLLTLPQPPTVFNCHDCDHRTDRLRLLGVDENRVRVLPIVGSGTYGEALTALAFARGAGIRRLVVATSPYHTRRALTTFQEVFEASDIEIGVEPAMASSPAQPSRWWWSGYDRAYVFYEWAAVAYYAWHYGV